MRLYAFLVIVTSAMLLAVRGIMQSGHEQQRNSDVLLPAEYPPELALNDYYWGDEMPYVPQVDAQPMPDVAVNRLRLNSESVSIELINRLDRLWELLGGQIIVSPAAGSVVRRLGGNDTSQHNADRWGVSRAADVMLVGVSLRDGYDAAVAAGFTGIGVYPDWKPYHGLHVDVRDGSAARWSGYRNAAGEQVYGSIETGLGLA